jgi:AraC-like DNA-binding protein
VRVDHARRLLLIGRDSLDEIAYRTGFHDQSHFARAFKKCLGVTPGAYRVRGEDAATSISMEIPMTRDLSYYQLWR